MTTDQHRKEQLGMPFGTACHRLRQKIMFDLICRLHLNVCFKCDLPITSALEMSIEHKTDWLHVNSDLFWDLNNIAYSHRKCNRPSRFNKPLDIHGTNGKYQTGCKCKPCLTAHSIANNEWRYKKGLRTRRVRH